MPSTTAVKITNKNAEAMLMINALVGDLAKTAKQNKQSRSDDRYPLETKVILGKREGPDQFVPLYESWGEDISNQGVGLLMTKPLEKSRRLYIVLRIPKQGKLFAHILVRRCDKLTADMYRIGATFEFEDKESSASWVQ